MDRQLHSDKVDEQCDGKGNVFWMNPIFARFTCAVMQSRDPSTNVVLLEDAAAVIGVIMAASCMGLTSLTGKQNYRSSLKSRLVSQSP